MAHETKKTNRKEQNCTKRAKPHARFSDAIYLLTSTPVKRWRPFPPEEEAGEEEAGKRGSRETKGKENQVEGREPGLFSDSGHGASLCLHPRRASSVDASVPGLVGLLGRGKKAGREECNANTASSHLVVRTFTHMPRPFSSPNYTYIFCFVLLERDPY